MPIEFEPSGAPLEVFVDFPQEGETVASGVYTFRIGVRPSASLVEISVDGGPWEPCRAASGYWWFDWVSFDAGEHELVARASGPRGAAGTSERRRFRRAPS